MVRDITKEFREKSNPGVGRVLFEEGYDKRTHPDEIHTAKWLLKNFGSDIVLMKEKKDQENPDSIWMGRYWEFKNLSSNNKDTVDKRLRKGLIQIRQNNGGVVIDFSKSKLDIIRAASMVVDSATRRSKKAIIIIVRKKDEFKVFQT